MKKLRVTGLVKSARLTREQLAAGIPPQEAEAFRRQVRGVVAQVKAICKEHNIQPRDLPTPSYRAYRYLESLDLDDLPLRQGTAPERPQTIYITGVVAAQNEMNASFADWAAGHQRREEPLTAQNPDVQHFAQMLAQHVEEIEVLAREQGGLPAHLPTRSRRAYQWLKFLSDPTMMITHLETLRTLLREFDKPRCHPKVKPTPVEIAFAHTTHLYRARSTKTGTQVTIHEGFVGAPLRVLRALVCAVRLKDEGAYLETIKSYGSSEEFHEVMLALEMTTAADENVTQGYHFDLEVVFERVNATYFEGQLARPGLTWNQTITGFKFGHYDYLRDTIMISVTFDAPGVPDYAIDFVMYHEMLHKQMGINVINGRRYAHTPEFRAAERRFLHYEEAQTFLRSLRKTVG
jgi:hypothetical protein